jgi:hypothetical protein
MLKLLEIVADYTSTRVEPSASRCVPALNQFETKLLVLKPLNAVEAL